MNEKLSLQDLVDLLSKKAKITKKDADSFFREFFQLILERIFDNDFVKIKDFGTFKLISVSSRDSVNVNTGEKIEIPSHYKLSFIPDKVLKNLVNKPFSQFETILLEDGVVFETFVEDDEDIDADVDENNTVESTKANINKKEDDVDIVNEARQTIAVEPVSEKLNVKLEVKETHTRDTENSEISKPKSLGNQTYPRSFVYTYTSSSSEQNTGSVILTVPKDDLQGGTPASNTEKQAPLQEIREKKEFPIELKDLPEISVTDDDSSIDLNEKTVAPSEGDIEEVITTEIKESLSEPELENESKERSKTSVSENEVSLSTPLIKDIIADDIELESDFDSEIETEKDVIIPALVVGKIIKAEEEKHSSTEDIPQKASMSPFSNEDPERPLFPGEDEEDIIDDSSFVPLNKKFSKEELDIVAEEKDVIETLNSRSFAGNNKPTEIRGVSFSDTIDPVDIPYNDYSNQGGISKLKKWLPVILFFLVIVGFLTYGLVKMLTKPYDFEYNLGRTNLSAVDSTTTDEDTPSNVQVTDALLDSMKRVQRGLVEDTVKPMKQEPIVAVAQKPEVKKQTVESTTTNVVGYADSLTTEFVNAEKTGFVISDKLKFGILNKAEYHLHKYAGKNRKETIGAASSQPAKPDVKAGTASKPQYSTIKRGATLRTMAATYYGSPDYWVYIYQANKNNIANPNNVPIGTRLLIPSLADYGVYNPKDPKAIQTAKNLETKILR